MCRRVLSSPPPLLPVNTEAVPSYGGTGRSCPSVAHRLEASEHCVRFLHGRLGHRPHIVASPCGETGGRRVTRPVPIRPRAPGGPLQLRRPWTEATRACDDNVPPPVQAAAARAAGTRWLVTWSDKRRGDPGPELFSGVIAINTGHGPRTRRIASRCEIRAPSQYFYRNTP